MYQVNSKDECCGCEACEQICPKKCIKMHSDSEGFVYPTVDENLCIRCGLCVKVCPLKNVASERLPLTTLAVKNKNSLIKKESSSGGFFYELARIIIENGGVVFGAAFDDKWDVHHIYTETDDGIHKMMGSKYVQSRIELSYKKAELFLKEGKLVLFTGCPCQIAGFQSYLRGRSYPNLILADFLCHGVPSPKVWQLYKDEVLEKIKRKTGENLLSVGFIDNIEFRNKDKGWRNYSFVVKGKSDHINDNILFFDSHKENIYMKGFLNNLYLRPSCHSCKFKRFQSHSDITFADYWGIYRVNPEFNDDEGVSMVFINTENGKQYFNKLKDKFNIIETKFIDTLTNGGLSKCILPHKKRNYFFHQLTSSDEKISVLIERCLKEALYKKIVLKILYFFR